MFTGCSSSFTFNLLHWHGHNQVCTIKCLSIGKPKTINLPFVPNGKLMDFRRPNIQARHNYAVICLNFGTPKNE